METQDINYKEIHTLDEEYIRSEEFKKEVAEMQVTLMELGIEDVEIIDAKESLREIEKYLKSKKCREDMKFIDKKIEEGELKELTPDSIQACLEKYGRGSLV